MACWLVRILRRASGNARMSRADGCDAGGGTSYQCRRCCRCQPPPPPRWMPHRRFPGAQGAQVRCPGRVFLGRSEKNWARAGGTDRRDGARAAIAPSIPHSLVVLQLSGLTGDARQGAQWLCSDRVPPGPANPAGRSSACLQLDAMLGAVAAACGPPGCEHARAPARLAPPRRRHNACRQPTSLSALSRGLSYCQCSGRGDEWIGRELKT